MKQSWRCGAVCGDPALGGAKAERRSCATPSRPPRKIGDDVSSPPWAWCWFTNTNSSSARHDLHFPRTHSMTIVQHDNAPGSRLLNASECTSSPRARAQRLQRGPHHARSAYSLTDLAFSCKARAATTQPAGPGARRRPSTNGRAELTEHQDVTCAALTDATPS